MALSGSFQSNAITSITNNVYPRYLYVEWSATQSIENNKSYVSYTVKSGGTKSTSYFECGPVTVSLGGVTLYSIPNGSRQRIYSNSVLASGSFEVTHNSETGAATMAASIQAALYDGYINSTYSGTITLDTIPRSAKILTAPNFDDESNPTITYSNPAGNNVTLLEACISLTGAVADVSYRAISKTGSSYTFNLTEAERKTLRANTTSSNGTRTVLFYIRTTIGTNIFYHSVSKTLSLKNFTPQLAASVRDVNPNTVALTGDSNTFIRYFSDAEVTIAGMPRKEATITKYEATNGSKKITASTGIIEGVETDTFTFSVTDSRNITVSTQATKTLIPYNTFTCKMTPKVVLSTSDSTKANLTVAVEGNYYNGSFGAVDNAINITVEVATQAGVLLTETFDIGTEVNLNGGSFTGSKTIEDLDYREVYTVRLTASDALTTVVIESDSLRATPVFDWGEEDFNFNVPVTIQGALVPSIVDQGTDYTGWTYRKWSDGTAECWCGKEVSVTFPSTANWGGLFTSGAISGSNLEFPDDLFIETPNVQVSLQIRSAGGILMAPGGAGGNTANATQTGIYEIARGTYVSGAQQYTINYYVKGRWK